MPAIRPHNFETDSERLARENATRAHPYSGRGVTAVLGPTNTGKTHLAIERMISHPSGIIGLPLRLLAREVYTRLVERVGVGAVSLVTGEEKIQPPNTRYSVCTVEAMPRTTRASFVAIDEVQLAGDLSRGHVFTDRLLNLRGLNETLLLGAATMRGILTKLLPGLNVLTRPRMSHLAYAGSKKITRLPRKSAIVAFSADEVYAIAELIRRQRGGAAVVLGALSPRTRNAQVELFQHGEVEFLVATDAIGMGLNLDLDHVAFAQDHKFDGHQTRPLTPAEMAQIAGRAGRHVKDGTFGVTGHVSPLDDEVVERIESHDFAPVKTLQWRTPEFDFSSVEALRASIERPPGVEGLSRALPAHDARALDILARDEGLVRLANTPLRVKLLWAACALPDYRRIAPAQHAELVASIFRDLATLGHVDESFMASQVERADSTDGEIDTLSARVAQIRTWTFVSHRPNWLRDPLHWQGVTREVEDRLSDALHERLTKRFVDRRTSVLMRRLRENAVMEAEIGPDGEVSVEGHAIGHLEGFRFRADRAAEGQDAKAVQAASAKALALEFEARAARLAASPNGDFVMGSDGSLRWQGELVGQLAATEDALRPRVVLLADEHLTGPSRDRVAARLERHMRHQIETLLKPLLDLRDAPSEMPKPAAGVGSANTAEEGDAAEGVANEATASPDEETPAGPAKKRRRKRKRKGGGESEGGDGTSAKGAVPSDVAVDSGPTPSEDIAAGVTPAPDEGTGAASAKMEPGDPGSMADDGAASEPEGKPRAMAAAIEQDIVSEPLPKDGDGAASNDGAQDVPSTDRGEAAPLDAPRAQAESPGSDTSGANGATDPPSAAEHGSTGTEGSEDVARGAEEGGDGAPTTSEGVPPQPGPGAASDAGGKNGERATRRKGAKPSSSVPRGKANDPRERRKGGRSGPPSAVDAGVLTGTARGLAFRLVEEMGVIPRREVAEEVRSLGQEDRAVLRRYGVRFGFYHIFVPALLKPGPAELLTLLWALKNDAMDRPGYGEVVPLLASGRTSVVVDPSFERQFYRLAGFRVMGGRAVRIDILERLADLIRPALQWEPGKGKRPEAGYDGRRFIVTPGMMSILGASEDDIAVILKALGYRGERVRASEVADTLEKHDAGHPPGTEGTVGIAVERKKGRRPRKDDVKAAETDGKASPDAAATDAGTGEGAVDAALGTVGDLAQAVLDGAATLIETAGGTIEPSSPNASKPPSDVQTADEDQDGDGAPSNAAASANEPNATSEPADDAAQASGDPASPEAAEEPTVLVWRQAPAADRRPRGRRDEGQRDGRQRSRGRGAPGQDGRDDREGKPQRGKGGKPGKDGGPSRDGGKGGRPPRRDDDWKRHAGGPRKGGRRREPDPDSPFAKLAALKGELSKK